MGLDSLAPPVQAVKQGFQSVRQGLFVMAAALVLGWSAAAVIAWQLAPRGPVMEFSELRVVAHSVMQGRSLQYTLVGRKLRDDCPGFWNLHLAHDLGEKDFLIRLEFGNWMGIAGPINLHRQVQVPSWVPPDTYNVSLLALYSCPEKVFMHETPLGPENAVTVTAGGR